MKIEITPKDQTKEIEFPCLMISSELNAFNKSMDVIILCTNQDEHCLSGMVIYTKDPRAFIGESCDTWSKSSFKKFEGSITISND